MYYLRKSTENMLNWETKFSCLSLFFVMIVYFALSPFVFIVFFCPGYLFSLLCLRFLLHR